MGVNVGSPAHFGVAEELIELARESAGRGLARYRPFALALAGVVLVAAFAEATYLPPQRPFSIAAALISVIVYAIVSRVSFEFGNGRVFATELVLVPMLFALPARDVPLLVIAGCLLRESPDFVRGRTAIGKWPLSLFDAAHALGPALVLSAAGAGTPRWDAVPVYLAALGAQFAADLGPSGAWSWVRWRIPFDEHVRNFRVPALFDSALAPIGLLVAIAAADRPWQTLIVLPLVALLAVFARERQTRIDHALELSRAYRGTAMLLGDVIEADDVYTGGHSRDVVDLVLAVGDRLGLDSAERRRAEFAAMLHDVGKVKIPSEVINKPGALDAAERALIETHTILGEEMLAQIGGLLGQVGQIVRSCHERWDGTGYPDRLAGEQIPLAARIVCVCDAWSAMTDNRVYRRARTPEEAISELRDCSGTHFDPVVVETLIAVLRS